MEFDFSVIDGASGAFKAMDSSLDKLEEQLKSVDTELYKMERHEKLLEASAIKDPMKQKAAYMRIYRDDLREATKANQEAEGPFAALGKNVADIEWLEAGKMAAEFAEKVYDLGKEFVKAAFEAQEFREDSLRTLDFMLGGKEAAKDEMEMIDKMASGTKMSVKTIMGEYRDLFSFTTHFGKKATQDVVAAAEDVNTVLGDNAKGAFLSVIKNAEAMGKLDERAMRQLKEVGIATPEKLLRVIAEQHHTTMANAESMLKAGRISAAEGTNALLGLVRGTLDKGGALGSVAKEDAADSPIAGLKNIGDAWDKLLSTVDPKPLGEAFAKLAKMLDPTTESGKQMQAVLEQAFQVVSDVVGFAIDNMDLFKTIFGGVISVIQAEGAGIKVVGEALGDAAFWIVTSFTKAYQAVAGFFHDAYEIGSHFIDGLVDGIKSGWGRVTDTVNGLSHSVVEGMRNVLGIHSRSKVMFELGGYTAQGMEEGIEARTPRVRARMMDVMLPTPKFGMAMPELPGERASRSSTGDVSGAPLMFAISDMRGGGGGARSFQGGDITVELHVDGDHAGAAHDPKHLAELVAQHVREEVQPIVRAEIVRFMEDDSIAN